MKKIISFFILLIFFGAVFFIGWTQIKVKPDSYAIVISKTSGVNPNPVIPGEFSWHWQFLIPTNAELKIFSINPVNAKKTISGSVTNPNSIQNIDYSFDFAISLTVSPQTLIQLYNQNQISSQQTLDEYLQNIATSIAQMSADYIINKIKTDENFSMEKLTRNEIVRSIQYQQKYPFVDLMVLSVENYKIPDYKAYMNYKNDFVIPEVTNQETTNE
ncbi:MAG: hypothetical protein E7060_07650 [Treponema bryantii]|nr:hypothetical protein [Treponema bryantii]